MPRTMRAGSGFSRQLFPANNSCETVWPAPVRAHVARVFDAKGNATGVTVPDGSLSRFRSRRLPFKGEPAELFKPASVRLPGHGCTYRRVRVGGGANRGGDVQ